MARVESANPTDRSASSGGGGPARFGAGLGLALGRWPIAVVLAGAALTQVLIAASQIAPRYARPDFSVYYVSALAMRQGADPYADDLRPLSHELGLDVGPMTHVAETPPMVMGLELLTTMPPRLAHQVWTAFNLLLLAAALWILLSAPGGWSAATRVSLAALALMYPPLKQQFFWGQSQVLVLFLLVMAMRSLRSGNDAAAGTAIALAGLLRAYPLLMVVYLLMRRNWRALGWMAGCFAGGMLTTAGVIGIGRCFSWVRFIGWNSGYWQSGTAFDIGLAPFVSRLFWHSFGAHLGPVLNILRAASSAAAEVFILVVAIRATPRDAAQPDPEMRAFGLWVAAAILLSPIAWVHYMVLLLIPFLLIVHAALEVQANIRALSAAVGNYLLCALWLGFLAWYDPHVFAGWVNQSPPAVIAVAEMGFVVMLLGFLAAYWFAADEPPAGV